MKITGALPIPISVLTGQKTVKCRDVIMSQITVAQSLAAQSQLQPNQYIVLAELAAMTTLVGDDGHEYQLTYDALASTSRQNLHALQSLSAALDAKEQAESMS